MFTTQCTACERRQLIFPSQITNVCDTPDGTSVAYTCWCGAAQTWLTGRAAASRHLVAA